MTVDPLALNSLKMNSDDISIRGFEILSSRGMSGWVLAALLQKSQEESAMTAFGPVTMVK